MESCSSFIVFGCFWIHVTTGVMLLIVVALSEDNKSSMYVSMFEHQPILQHPYRAGVISVQTKSPKNANSSQLSITHSNHFSYHSSPIPRRTNPITFKLLNSPPQSSASSTMQLVYTSVAPSEDTIDNKYWSHNQIIISLAQYVQGFKIENIPPPIIVNSIPPVREHC